MILPIQAALPPMPFEEPRLADIKRTCEELSNRAGYAKAFIAKANSYKWQLLHAANHAKMSDEAFRIFFNLIAYGKEDGTDIFPANKTIADITGKSARACQRAAKELENQGWLENRRQRRGPTIRAAGIPAHIQASIVKEISQTTNLTLQETPIFIPNLKRPQAQIRQETPEVTVQDSGTSKQSFEVLEPTNLVPRHTKNDTLTNNNQNTLSACARARRVDPPGWQMAAALSLEERRAQAKIWRVEGGGVDISAELRAELERDFALVPIDDTLRILKTESAMKDTALRLIEALERKLAYAQRDERNRERRYSERAAQKPPQKYPEKPSDDEKKRRELRALGVKI